MFARSVQDSVGLLSSYMAYVLLETKNISESPDLKKWITVDRSRLIDVFQPVDEFVFTLGEA